MTKKKNGQQAVIGVFFIPGMLCVSMGMDKVMDRLAGSVLS